MLKIALFLHIISAIFWIGGMLFLVAVIAPYLKTIDDPRAKGQIFQVMGRQYRKWGWAAIVTLLITGPFMLLTIYPDMSMYSPSTGFGLALTIKLTLVTLIVISSFVHDFFIGPKARNSPRHSALARVFGRANLIMAVIIVIFAVILRLGGI